MTTLNKSNFFQTVQHILERYYLKPLDGSEKIHLQDGFVERTVHGATHASRAALWVLVMHHFLQNKAPDFVNESMDKIAQHLAIETEELLLLILLTTVCHDAGRKGEGRDEWESESAEITHTVLMELGLDSLHAQLFSMAIEYKDKPGDYTNRLNQLGIEPQDSKVFGYIRVLINLGDKLDIMRCVGEFRTTHLFSTLKHIDGFNETQHAQDVIALAQTIHHIIHNQGDMLFACSIIDSNDETFCMREARISAKEKVGFEHADNVLAVLFEDIAKNALIGPLLVGLEVPKAQKYTLQPAFDPFIHGTNSSIFSILPKSNFEIMSPIDMMRTYQAAPMTGELTQGGYKTVETKSLGRTSLVKLSTQGDQTYTLEKVINSYTRIRVDLPDQHITNFKKTCDNGFHQSYLNINLILIYFVRARQSHQSLEQVISATDLDLLFAKMEASYQFYYLIQLLGTHIFPNVSELNKFRIMGKWHPDFKEEAKHMSLAAANFLTYENIVEKIRLNAINIKEVFDNPTQEKLHQILELFEVPKKCTLKDSWDTITLPDIELPLTQFFCITPDAFEYVKYHQEQDVFWSMQLNKNSDSNAINHLLKKFIDGFASNELFISLGSQAQYHAEVFHERMQLFKQLVTTPQSQFKITDIQTYFLDHTFPIILLSDAETKISIMTFSTGEYRSHTNLSFGEDVKIIATNTNFHRLEVLKYLEMHNINTIQVILFSDLEKIKTTHQKLATAQHHSDGVPTLKWMAARQIPKSLAQSIREDSSILAKQFASFPQLGSEKNVSEVSALLDDVKVYDEIEFEPCCTYRCASKTHHEAIELLVKAGFEQTAFQSLIGNSGYAKENSLLASVIIYLNEINLPQLYKKALVEREFRGSLALFIESNSKEGVTEDLLNDDKVMQWLYDRRYFLNNSNHHYIQAVIALHTHNIDVLDGEISGDLAKLIVYFDEHKLQKYFKTLVANKENAYRLLTQILYAKPTNEMISAILDDNNMMQAVGKDYIWLQDPNALKAGFILSKMGIEIKSSIGYKTSEVVLLLDTQGFTDKSYYVKAISSKKLMEALSDFEIKTVFAIHAVFKANEFDILDNEFSKIKQCPQLTKMLAFTTNKDEWQLCREFYTLLVQFPYNTHAHDIAVALVKDIDNAIDTCFSFDNTDPNKMQSFSVKANQLIEAARAVLELNTGLLGVLDTPLLFLSNLGSSGSNNGNYSFFKNESAKLIETIQVTLGKMRNNGSNLI